MIDAKDTNEFNKDISFLNEKQLNNLLEENNFNEFETHLSNIPFVYFYGLDNTLFNKGVKLINKYIKVSEKRKRFTYRLLSNYILKADRSIYDYIGSNLCNCFDIYKDAINGVLFIFAKADKNIKNNVFSSILDLINSDKLDIHIKFSLANTYYLHKLYGSNFLLGYCYHMFGKDNKYENALKYYSLESNKNEFNLYNRMALIYAYILSFANSAKANQCFKKSLSVLSGENFGEYAEFLRLDEKYKNIPLAIKYYKKSIELGYEKSLIGLASIYAYENNYINYTRAFKLLDKLTDGKEKYFEKAEIYSLLRDYDSAIINYHKSLEYGEDGYTYEGLGNIYNDEKSENYSLAKAEKCYINAIKYGEYNAAFYLGKLCYRKKQNIEEANKYFRLAMTNKKYLSRNGRLEYAWFLTNNHKYKNVEKAIAILNGILDDTDNTMAKLTLANIYMNFSGYIDLDKAYDYLKSCEKIELTFSSLGELYLKKGNYFNLDKAIKCYKKAGELGDNESYYYLGMIYYDDIYMVRDYAKAKEYFLKSIPSLFDNEVYFMLGNIYSLSNDFDDVITAIKYYEKCEDDDTVWTNLGSLYQRKLNNIDKAIEYYKKACHNNHDIAYFAMGSVYGNSNTNLYDVNLAIKYYEKCINLAKDNSLDMSSISFKQRSYYEIGHIYLTSTQVKDEAKALNYLKKAHTEAANKDLVEYYCDKNDFNSAIKYALETLEFKHNSHCDYFIEYIYNSFDYISMSQITEVIEKLKSYNNSAVYKIIGDIYKYPNLICYNAKKAFNYYLKSIELDNNNDEAHYALGYCYYYGQGIDKDLIKAKYHFERALKNSNKCSHIVEIINVELGIGHNNSNLRNILNTKTTFKQIENFIEKTFALTRVDENVKSDLVTALSIYVALSKEQINEKTKLDFSPCINLLFKCLENIIRKYFIVEYRKYLFDEVPSYRLSKNRYFTTNDDYGVCVYKEHGKFEKFTLQDFDKIIGLNKFEGKSILQNKNKFTNYNMISDFEGSTICIDEVFLEYLIGKLFDYNGMNPFKYSEECINYLILLDNYIDEAVDIYRNPAIHYEIMSKENAEAVINDFLFDEKILINFYNKLRL